jgi:formylglycine-generating enzyme required for sulfatase activity
MNLGRRPDDEAPVSNRIACPKCDFSSNDLSSGPPPSHCPACGSRMSCPRCGAALTRHQTETALLHCSNCGVDLDGLETRPLEERTPPPTEVSFAVPGFQLRGELGRGGMGVVYRAWQESMRRDVALKVLPPALAADANLLQRFRNEANLAGRLVNSHLLPVHDVQEVQGVPVIVMPLIDGSDLGRLIRDRIAVREGRTPRAPHPWACLDDRTYLERLLPLLDQVMEGVVALHQAGVLHRDLKPSNVLVDERGNAWVSDFGLARLEEQGGGTRPGMVVGTLTYASPEQAAGKHDIDRRSDLFSLGVLLYQALTLRLPFGKGGARHATEAAVPPSLHQPLLPPGFDKVLLKALEREREQRYASAAEMQEDWQRVRRGLAPRALLAGRWRRFGRALQRHRAWAAVAAVLLLTLGMAAFVLRRSATPIPDLKAGIQPGNEAVLRAVRIETEPPGARLALVPIHPELGIYLSAQAIRPTSRTPVTLLEVPSGRYLVVAEVPGHGFHEVYRTVPRLRQTRDNGMAHSFWAEEPDGTVVLPTITIPSNDVVRGMVRFAGDVFEMGTKELPHTTPHSRHVAAFYLDRTEITIGAVRKVASSLPRQLTQSGQPDSYPACWVTFYQALSYVEKLGKRLPEETEYEYVATGSGQLRYPWGNGPPPVAEWRFGPAGEPAFDHTLGDQSVLGLFSNVAEWTTTWNLPYPVPDPMPPDLIPQLLDSQYASIFQATRIVRGGPWDVVDEKGDRLPWGAGPEWQPRHRLGATMENAHRGLGFRCARSQKPRFLEP